MRPTRGSRCRSSRLDCARRPSSDRLQPSRGLFLHQILVCEDEANTRGAICDHLVAAGYEVSSACDGEEALAAYAQTMPDAVLLDLNMPRLGGLDVLRRLRSLEPSLPVIVVTADVSLSSAIAATKLGASAYVVKPIDTAALTLQLERVLPSSTAPARYGDLIGASPAMRGTFAILTSLERVNAPTVLITGETGAGKDLIARAIHQNGPRRDKPFMAIDCASISEALIESELFGHERGSFTDAHGAKRGLFEIARGGLIFLDEIGEMAPPMQAKLLRALESRSFRRVGGVVDIPLDAGILAATHRDLRADVKSGRFREDLFFRLNVVPISVPPLRERRGDIDAIAIELVARIARDLERQVGGIQPDALEALRNHTWPGNVRELRNVLERTVIFKRDEEAIALADLPVELAPRADAPRPPMLELPERGIDLAALERDLLQQAMVRTGGNLTRAAKLLHLTRFALRYRLEKHGLLPAKVPKHVADVAVDVDVDVDGAVDGEPRG